MKTSVKIPIRFLNTDFFRLRSFFIGGLVAVLFFSAANAGEKRAMGFIPDDPGRYAATPKVSRYRAYLSPEADLSRYFPKPGNQGKQSSCVAWATAYAARSYLEARREGNNPNTPDHIFSPAFIFNQVNIGNCENGGSIGEALSLMKKSGVASLADFPYDEKNCSRLPTPVTLTDAARYRIDGWKRVDIDSLDDVKGQIYAGNPVIIGMFVSKSFEDLGKNQLYDDLSAPRSGGHAMVVVGYSEPKQAFKVVNSWGEKWGDDGFGWISYRAFQKWTQNAYVMQIASTPAPVHTSRRPISASVLPKPLTETAAERPIVLEPPTPAPQPVAVRPEPPQEKADRHTSHTNLTAVLSALTGKAKCADLQSTIASDGHVRITGFASQLNDLQRITAELDKLGTKVNLQATVRPWPQCEALLTFKDVFAKPSGLKLAVIGHAMPSLDEGEQLNIEINTPTFPSYLYLTYIQANGDAVLLAQPTGRLPKALPPNTHLSMGSGENGGAKFTISPPFGNEMIIAIAAASPLLPEGLPKTMTEREYLTLFRRAFLTKPEPNATARVIAGTVLTLTTHHKL